MRSVPPTVRVGRNKSPAYPSATADGTDLIAQVSQVCMGPKAALPFDRYLFHFDF